MCRSELRSLFESNKKMGYWKSTVVPKFKKIFDKNNTKKSAAAEACKAFDDAKVDILSIYVKQVI